MNQKRNIKQNNEINNNKIILRDMIMYRILYND